MPSLSRVLLLTSAPLGKPGAWPGLQEPSAMLGGLWGARSSFCQRGAQRRCCGDTRVPRLVARCITSRLVWNCSLDGMYRSRREHSRRRQSLINILNHLFFDLNPDSYSDTESGELKTYFVKALLADAVVKQGSLALRKGRSFRKESKRSELIQKDKQCMSVCILGFTYEIQSW